MKRDKVKATFARISIFFSYLSILCVLCVSISAQDWKTLKDGIEHAEVRREFSGKPVNINLLRLDLKKVRLDVHHAMDAAIGTEKTSSIAMRHGAFAAINAGFFRLDTSIFAGESAGLLQINGKLLSESAGWRTELLINNDLNSTQVLMARHGGAYAVKIGKTIFETVGVNRERIPDDLVIYTPEFHRTTLTSNAGVEVVVVRDRIFSTVGGSGSTSIPSGGFVLSASGKLSEQLKKAAIRNTRVALLHRGNALPNAIYSELMVNKDGWDFVGGVPQLIKNGKIDITWEQEKSSKAFVETRHPRTAVAKLKDGKFLMVTVDGRSEASAGIDLYDLAAYLLELGALDAMNLDGGGSTTMFLDGRVVNKPSDKEGERRVGDAILVTPRKPKK